MLKHKVISIHKTQSGSLAVATSESVYGNRRVKGNPIIPPTTLNQYKENLDIKVGDLVRCDGLPFKVRPQEFYREDGCVVNVGQGRYKPFQLNNGYWVLRWS